MRRKRGYDFSGRNFVHQNFLVTVKSRSSGRRMNRILKSEIAIAVVFRIVLSECSCKLNKGLRQTDRQTDRHRERWRDTEREWVSEWVSE